MNCSCQSSGGDSPSTTISHAPRRDASHRVTSPRAAAKEIALHYYQLQFCCRQRAAGGTGRSTNQPTPCPSPAPSLAAAGRNLCCIRDVPHRTTTAKGEATKLKLHVLLITCLAKRRMRNKKRSKRGAGGRGIGSRRVREGAGGKLQRVGASLICQKPKGKRQISSSSSKQRQPQRS